MIAMPRELMLLRHGKSDWSAGETDFRRPLKNRGKRGAQRMGVWIWQQDLRPDTIVSSPAERARATAHKVCKTMGFTQRRVKQDQRIYEASVGDLRRVLAEWAGERVMLVGHNPGFEDLLRYLCAETPTPFDGKLLPTATLARIELPDDWGNVTEGCGRLIQIKRPHDLPRKFPFPAPLGPEERDRPAYYYTQSAVIPWRRNEGELQVLIISSSKVNHWVVPKGCGEPELSLQESAAQEAREEAGIEGSVGEQSIGGYATEKWNAAVTVTVYPMEVTWELPDEKWEESHRERRWVDVETAAQRVKQPELRPMIRALPARLGLG